MLVCLSRVGVYTVDAVVDQVVYQKGKDLYILLNRWGRIGDTGQFQRTPFPKKDEAVKEFCKVFRAKTGNKWEKVKRYVRSAQIALSS